MGCDEPSVMEEIEITRNGREAVINCRNKTATIEFERPLPAGPSDWMQWVNDELNIVFDANTKINEVDELEGTIRLSHRGGSRESINIYDTKPRKLV